MVDTIMHNMMMVIIVLASLKTFNAHANDPGRTMGSRQLAALFSLLLFISSIYCAIWGR